MPFLPPTDKKKALLARKEQLLNEIKYYEKRINEVSQDTISINFEDSSDSEDEYPFTVNHGPSTIYNLKEQEKMLQTCLSATRELSSLYVLQSKVDIMVEDPVFEGEPLKTKPGLWREVNADCQIDLVQFSTTFYVHQADGLFGAKSFRNLKVVPVKPSHEAELAKSVLTRVATPSDAVEVLRNYSIAHRSRRATLAKLAGKFQSNLYMEPRATGGGFLLKCANLLEISWVLENKWSCIAPFYHKMVFELDVIDECYLKIIRHAHKQLNDPSTDTDERTLILTKIINTCLEAHRTQLEESMESETDSVQKIEKRRLTLENEVPEPKKMKKGNNNDDNEDGDMNENNKENNDDQIMAPPKSVPKKVKSKGKENTDQNRKSVKRPAGEDEAGNTKKAKKNRNDPNNDNKNDPNSDNKNNPNNDNNKNNVVHDVIRNNNQDVNDTVDRNKNSVAKSQGSKLNKTEKTQTKVIEPKKYDTKKKGSTGNVKDIQKVTENQKLKYESTKNQNKEKESVEKNLKAKPIKPQNLEVKEQTKAVETKINLYEKVGGTQNVKGKENVTKSQNLKEKVIKTQSSQKPSVKDSKKIKVTEPKNQVGTAVAKENSDIQKETVNNQHINENANMQENLKKKVVKDTNSQKVNNDDKIVDKSSKIDQIAKNSESKKIHDEAISQPQTDSNTKNSEAQKVRSKEKKVASSSNDKKSNSKEPNYEQLGISPKVDQMLPEIIASNKAKLLEIDDIPIMSTYNVNIDKVSKKDHNNVKPVKTQKVAKKYPNINEKPLKNDKSKNIPKSANTDQSDNNKKSNIQNVAPTVVNKERKPNNKIGSSDNAVSKNDKQLEKININKIKSKNNDLKYVQKSNTQKLTNILEDIDKNTVKSSNKEIASKGLNEQNQEKIVNSKENFENNPKVTEINEITERVTKIGNNKTKEQLANLKKSNTKIGAVKPKMVVKNFALTKKTSKKLNNSFEIKVNSDTKIDADNDSGSKNSKIPMKLSIHYPLRVSPRRLPATLKSASDTNLKQKSYFTNIPRLTKNTVFKKISK